MRRSTGAGAIASVAMIVPSAIEFALAGESSVAAANHIRTQQSTPMPKGAVREAAMADAMRLAMVASRSRAPTAPSSPSTRR